MNLPLWRTSEFHTFFSPFCIGIHTFFGNFALESILFSAMFLEFLTFVCHRFGKFRHFSDMNFGISYYFQFGMREGRYRGHWNSRHFWSCLYSGFLYLFPLTYSGRYRGHWNSIQFCIHVIVWFWMLLKTRQYNQHDTGREKLLCEYELMKT